MFAKLLSYISPGLSENTLPAILIGNLFLTDTLAFKWLCSHHSNGLVQAVADNFDCNISSMNGLKQTHSLAISKNNLQVNPRYRLKLFQE